MSTSANKNNSRKRVLSGMRPTGKLHLGNYMGALKNWVMLQNEVNEDGSAKYECYFFIADLHALTTDYADPSRIQQNTLEVALDFFAAGLDPEKSTVFVQSHVPAHSELFTLFSMFTPLGWLERVPTYKDQQEQLKEKDLNTYGFLGYPLLQAADILLYQPDFVPVGADQVAHVELTREVSRRFNSLYKTQAFPEPEALLTPSPKLPGLDGRKMSKSYGNTVGISEAPAIVFMKISGMSTNGQRVQQSDPGDPDLCPVGDMHKIFSSAEDIEKTQAGCRNATIRCEICKMEAARSVCAVTEPISQARDTLNYKKPEIWEILRKQADRAALRAEETMVQIRTLFGVSRGFGSLPSGIRNSTTRNQRRDLSSNKQWWSFESDLRARKIREYWHTNFTYDIPLTQESNRVFSTIERENEEPYISTKKKRIFVTTSREDLSGHWDFFIPQRSYEVWVLLCWEKDTWMLQDFVLPQNMYTQEFAKAKKITPKDEKIHLVVSRDGDNWNMRFENGALEQKSLNSCLGNYDPLN